MKYIYETLIAKYNQAMEDWEKTGENIFLHYADGINEALKLMSKHIGQSENSKTNDK